MNDERLPLTDEDQMMLIILPLTYAREKERIAMIDRAVDIAAAIPEDEKRSFTLAGICIAADKFINDDQVNRIGGMITMTKVGRMILKEYEERERRMQEELEESRKEIAESKKEIAESKKKIAEKDAHIAKLQKFFDDLIAKGLVDSTSLEMTGQAT